MPEIQITDFCTVFEGRGIGIIQSAAFGRLGSENLDHISSAAVVITKPHSPYNTDRRVLIPDLCHNLV
jgi:hypothetical protein